MIGLAEAARHTSRGIRGFLDRYGYWLTVLALTSTTLASLMPAGSPGDPGAIGVPDGFAHVVAYAAVIFFPAATPSVPLGRPIGVVLAWGLALELLQLLIGRSASLADIAANTVGVMVGLAIGYSLRRMLQSLS